MSRSLSRFIILLALYPSVSQASICLYVYNKITNFPAQFLAQEALVSGTTFPLISSLDSSAVLKITLSTQTSEAIKKWDYPYLALAFQDGDLYRYRPQDKHTFKVPADLIPLIDQALFDAHYYFDDAQINRSWLEKNVYAQWPELRALDLLLADSASVKYSKETGPADITYRIQLTAASPGPVQLTLVLRERDYALEYDGRTIGEMGSVSEYVAFTQQVIGQSRLFFAKRMSAQEKARDQMPDNPTVEQMQPFLNQKI